MEQSFAFNQSRGRDLEINEAMAIAVRFEAINKTTNRGFMPSRNRGYNQSSNTNTDANTGSAEEPELNAMRAPRDLSKVQCYNCQRFGHIQAYCRSPRAASTGAQNGPGRGREERKDQAGNETPCTE